MAPLVAVVVATALTLAFDLGVALARGWRPEPGYVALCTALSFGAALAIGLIAAPTRRAEVALALWIALNAWIASFPFVPLDLVSPIVLGGVAGGALLLGPRGGRTPVGAGVAAAFALGFVAVILSRLFGVLGIARPEEAGYLWTAAAVLAGLLLVHGGYARAREALRHRVTWLPGETPLTLAATAGLVLAIPLALTGPPTQTTVMLSGEGPAPEAGGAPILLLVLDTVRADHLSLYGYPRPTTPQLDAFVERTPRAVVYPLAFSPATWTLPAHASLFTGLPLSAHGAHSGRLHDLRHALDPDARLEAPVTLAEALRERGYRTAAILANAQVMFFHGMNRGFDQVVRPEPSGWLALTGERLRQTLMQHAFGHVLKPYPDAATISREVLRFLDDCGDAACFVLANYMEAHGPYYAAPPYRETFTGPGTVGTSAERYDEEILALDAELGALLAALERRGVLDRAWLVITSDHGEEFGEHGFHEHGSSVYNTQTRVPLLIVPPKHGFVARHDGAVGLLDVTATLSAAAGAPVVGTGRDLRGPIAPAGVPIEWFGSPMLPPDARPTARAVVVGATKLIEQGDGSRELYLLDGDPHERRDRSRAARDRIPALAEALPPLRARPLPAGERGRELPLDDVERLRVLGYTD